MSLIEMLFGKKLPGAVVILEAATGFILIAVVLPYVLAKMKMDAFASGTATTILFVVWVAIYARILRARM